MAPTLSAWRYLLSVSVSNEFRLRDLLVGAPLFQQALPAFGVAALFLLHSGDAIDSKVAKALTQFAPGYQYPHLFEVAEGKGPDGTLRGLIFEVTITQGHLALLADGAAQRGFIGEAVAAGGADQQGIALELLAIVGWQYGFYLGQRTAGLCSQGSVTVGDDPT